MMKIEQFSWQQGWQQASSLVDAALVLYFVSPELARERDVSVLLSERYPGARQLGCSTGGEICGPDVLDGSLTGVAIRFEQSHFAIAHADVAEGKDRQQGADLATQLLGEDLKLVFVLTDGINVNGSELVRGFKDVLPAEVLLTGGLAGDNAAFEETFVGVDGRPKVRQIAALGLYGRGLYCNSGCSGGWQVFGPQRIITRSSGNILYELDDKPALDLYKHYLGADAENLPGSALLFPLAIRAPGNTQQDLVRTIVGIDEEQKSLIFAGDVPEGYSAQLMTSSFVQLADGASCSAQQAAVGSEGHTTLAILISCIGRKLLMGQMVNDEVDAIKGVLPTATLSGFYSYGEIAPHELTGGCELHNQSMTITTIWEG